MIYFCIPAYNEGETVGVLLWKLRQTMEEYPRDYQVLVVDDASTDKTSEVLAPYARTLPLTVIRNRERIGYAASLDRLIDEAVRRTEYPRRDAVVVLQADFTNPPEEIPELLKRIEGGADIVSTTAEWSDEPRPRLVRWARALVGSPVDAEQWPDPVTDPLSGFRAYRIVALQKAKRAHEGAPLLQSEGWAANVELLRAVLPYARRVENVRVPLRYDRRRRGTRLRLWPTMRQLLTVRRTARPPVPEIGAALRSRRRKNRSGRRSGSRGRSSGNSRGRRNGRGGGDRSRGRNREASGTSGSAKA